MTQAVTAGNRFARLNFAYHEGAEIGDIVIALYEDLSPTATDRFITLSTNHVNPDGSLDPSGVPFYTDVVVHRVIDDFMFQTGDAANGDGTGGSPLGPFPDYFHPDLDFSERGMVAMANSGPDTNDCQFFITDAPTTWLDGFHMIFGKVITGWDVYETIITVPTDYSDRPTTPIDMAGVEIFQCDQQPGDVNLDGIVNDMDLSVVLCYWSDSWNPTTWEHGDFTDDQDTGDADLSLLLSNWPQAAGGAVVPEPGPLVVLVGSCVCLLRRRRTG